MLATAMDSWARLRSVAALVCICRTARGCYLGAGAGPTVCVCVPHIPARIVGVQLVRQGGRWSGVGEGDTLCRWRRPPLRIAVCA